MFHMHEDTFRDLFLQLLILLLKPVQLFQVCFEGAILLFKVFPLHLHYLCCICAHFSIIFITLQTFIPVIEIVKAPIPPCLLLTILFTTTAVRFRTTGKCLENGKYNGIKLLKNV